MITKLEEVPGIRRFVSAELMTNRIAGYFRGVYISQISWEHSQSSKIKILEEVRFSISIREITLREQELNWLFAKYKLLENKPGMCWFSVRVMNFHFQSRISAT